MLFPSGETIICIKNHTRAYSHLKKIIFAIEKATLGLATLPVSHLDVEASTPLRESPEPTETEPLLPVTTKYRKLRHEEANAYFENVLNEELIKIVGFYAKKEQELKKELASLSQEIKSLEESYLTSIKALERDDSVENIAEVEVSESYAWLMWSSKGLKGHKQRLEKKTVLLYVIISELTDYVELHETGFSKVLKKYEKVVGAKLKSAYMEKVLHSDPFLPDTKEELANVLDSVTRLYARISTEGKVPIAISELKSHLREHISWQRNTIWRDMIEQERRRETIGISSTNDQKWLPLEVCGFTIYIPRVISSQIPAVIIAIVCLLVVPTLAVFKTPEQNNCLGILVFCTILWAFEAIPLFVTAICVPFLVVIMRVLDRNGERLSSHDATKQIFSDMFGPVIMLLLGGFSLASALSKHHIAKAVASYILSKAGTKPAFVLLANMFVSTFATAPVLCFSLITPILRNLPRKDPYARCLIMGIAMAANVGGMASPISSPQNIIAIDNMSPSPSWLEWFIISIPVCIIINFLIAGILLFVYKPSQDIRPHELYQQSDVKLNSTQIYVIAVSIVTIILWCLEKNLESFFGDMGVIAIVPILCFYATGILTKDDWNSSLWSVVMLAMGGTALGKAIQSCGLLNVITSSIIPTLSSWSTFICLVVVTGIVLVITTFISHTVGALIILPVVADLGSKLPHPIPRTMVMCSALMCSGGMGLPVSSFPNMNAISLEDPTGVPWLSVSDFLIVGIPSGLVAWFITLSIGYLIMEVMNFS